MFKLDMRKPLFPKLECTKIDQDMTITMAGAPDLADTQAIQHAQHSFSSLHHSKAVALQPCVLTQSVLELFLLQQCPSISHKQLPHVLLSQSALQVSEREIGWSDAALPGRACAVMLIAVRLSTRWSTWQIYCPTQHATCSLLAQLLTSPCAQRSGRSCTY